MQRSDTYLGASPPRDAPSPTPAEDVFAEGVEVALKGVVHYGPSHAINRSPVVIYIMHVDLSKPGSRDLIQASDMDIDEEMHANAAVSSSVREHSGPVFSMRGEDFASLLKSYTFRYFVILILCRQMNLFQKCK